MEVARIEIDGKKNRMGERGPEGLDDEQGVVGVRAQDADGPRAFPFLVNTRDQGPHVVELTGAFRTVTGHIAGLIPGNGFSRASSSRRVVTRHFPVESTEIAIAKHVERERLVVGGTLNLQIDRARHGRTPCLDVHRNLDLLQIGFREGGHLRTSRGAKLDGESPPVKRIPFPDEDHRVPAETYLPAL